MIRQFRHLWKAQVWPQVRQKPLHASIEGEPFGMLAHSEPASSARQLCEKPRAAQVALVHCYGLLPQQSALFKLLICSGISIPNGNSFSRLLYPFLLLRHVVPPMALAIGGCRSLVSRPPVGRLRCRASGRSAQVGYEESLESIGQGGVFNASWISLRGSFQPILHGIGMSTPMSAVVKTATNSIYIYIY